jgi:hypothetical protein
MMYRRLFLLAAVMQPQGGNQYVGILSWTDTENAQLLLAVDTTTRMEGSLVVTFNAEGFVCSSTTPVIATRD